MASTASRLDFLVAHQNSDGGWGYFPGRESRTESTAWMLRALTQKHPAAGQGIAFLLARQQGDGGLAPAPSVPGSTWVTSLAFPVLVQAAVEKKTLEALANWILRTEGAEGGLKVRFLQMLGKSPVDQDPRLKGWPWRPGNNSWVEPTAHGLLALQWMKEHGPAPAIEYRANLGTQMLLDRRCLDLGWNYGNKRVLGEVLPSYPETTALALLGFAGSKALPEKEQALNFAQELLGKTPGAYARALLTLALQAHGREVVYPLPPEAHHPSRNLMLTALEVLAASPSRGAFLP